MSARAAQQPQPIANHQEAGPHVRKNRHPHRRIPKDRKHQEHRLDTQRQHDVLKKDAPRAPGELDDFGDAAQIVIHDDDVRSLHGRVGSCCTHGKADVGACQRRCVIDAIPRHRRGTVLGLHLLNGRQLVFWQQVSMRLVDARLFGDGLCRGLVVSGQHDRGDSQRV